MLYRPKYRDLKTGKRKQARIWWYRIKFHGSEVRESTGTRSKTVARKIELRRRRDLEEGAGGIRRRSPRLFRLAAEQWLAIKRSSLAPKSIAAENSNLKHLLPFFGGMLSSDLEAEDVARYQEQRRKEKAAAGTINLEVATLRGILRRLGLWARLQPEVRMLPERHDVGRALTTDEEDRLLRECLASMSRSLYSAVVLALNTGLRLGELTGLRWEQVDFIRRRLTVGKSKTASGEGRAVPLNEAALNALTLQANRFPDREGEHFVFPTERYHVLEKRQGSAAWGLDPLKPISDMGQAWDAAKQRTADPKKRLPAVVCRWHDLRHTFVSRLVEGGTPYPKLAAILGWSPATAARMAKRYGHVSVEALREEVDRLDRPESDGKGAKKGAKWPPEAPLTVS